MSQSSDGANSATLSLAGVQLLHDIPENDRNALEQHCAFRRFAPGEIIVARFSAGNAVYFILSGTGRVVHYLPGEDEITIATIGAGDTVGEIAAILTELARQDPAVAARATLGLSRPPFEVSRDAEVVQTLAHAYQAALGRAPAFGGQTPWMDSALLAEAGVETVVFGPGGAGAHAAEEWVDLESVFAVAAVLAQAVAAYCG